MRAGAGRMSFCRILLLIDLTSAPDEYKAYYCYYPGAPAINLFLVRAPRRPPVTPLRSGPTRSLDEGNRRLFVCLSYHNANRLLVVFGKQLCGLGRVADEFVNRLCRTPEDPKSEFLSLSAESGSLSKH